MGKKWGGQIFEQQSSSPMNGILIVLVVLLGVWILYKAFLKKCPECPECPKPTSTETTTVSPA
jgi:hypothetical protein